MKKIFFSLALALTTCAAAWAIPANPKPVRIQQPDGSYITIVGHGDEFRNYVTTLDGYTVVRGDDQFYHYAALEEGVLVPTGLRAHDAGERTSTEATFLSTCTPHLMPASETQSIRRLKGLPMEQVHAAGAETTESEPLLAPQGGMDLDNFRGLVILVNFNDRKFTLGDDGMRTHVENMMNQENYTGYIQNMQHISCTGSVHDYFTDNTYGKFRPKFDVVGPITMEKYSCTSFNGTQNAVTITNHVISLVDDVVDFSQYDADNDGKVDMFYIIYAGYASSATGNNSGYLWPHAYDLYNGYYSAKKDGKYLSRYACSTELGGWESYGDKYLDGVGTICHEFSHVLGYMDHYDTSSGAHITPSEWDVMDQGSYNGEYSSCPAGYNAYERMAGGFLDPTELTSEDHETTITLNSLETEAQAYLIQTPQENEYFLIENRQADKWDSKLPSHGMLVWRVDWTNPEMWNSNKVNATNRSYFELIRASKTYTSTGSARDPYPGSNNVTSITNTTSPGNLLSYDKLESPVVIKGITEANRQISFQVIDPNPAVVMPEGTIFYESFNSCDGTGGNDGIFDNTISANTFSSDNEGWSGKSPMACNQCAFFGWNAYNNVYAITPAFTLEADKDYLLTFRAAPYNTDGTNLTLSTYMGNATMAEVTSESSLSSSVSLSMQKKAWTDYSIRMKGSGQQKIKFAPSRRFLLDEVTIAILEENAIDLITAPEEETAVRYNLFGQPVGDHYHGIVIQQGRKVRY